MSEVSSLGSTTSENQVGYEVTINISHIKPFKSLTTHDQKLRIAHIFKCMVNMIIKDYGKVVISSRRVFEYTEKGIIHLHGFLCTREQSSCISHAMCQDIARYIVKIINTTFKRHEYYEPNKYYDQYIRYKSPLCVISYCDTEHRFIEWNDYMSKAI